MRTALTITIMENRRIVRYMPKNTVTEKLKRTAAVKNSRPFLR